ncbi:MAG: efflux RND transporter periplasmic adaptor subunit [Gallionella sp.]
MSRISTLFGLLLLATTPLTHAADNVVLTTQQIQTLGIVTAPLPTKSNGDVSGLPAQVVVPGNQLFVMSSPMPGLVEQTLVGVGDSVRKGQVMATLQSPAFAEAQRGYLQASVQDQLAKDNLTRDESLFKDGIIAESRFRQSKGAALEAHAALAERKQLLRLSGMNDSALSKLRDGDLSNSLTLTAPIDGVVLEKTVSAGQRLDAAVPMFKVAKLTPLALEIQAPVAMTRDLRVGAVIDIPAFNASGKLTAIGRGLTGTNQSVLLRGIITKGTENLRPNQFVEASIATGGDGNTGSQWEIPNGAISRIDGKSMIFVSTAQGFRAQTVTIKNEGSQNSVITAALKGDEQIAVRGVSSLKSSLLGIGAE